MKFEENSYRSETALEPQVVAEQLHRQCSALLIQVADERQAFSEVRQGVENLRSAAETALSDLQQAKDLAEGVKRLQVALTSSELRLSSLENQTQRIATALNGIEGQLQHHRQLVAESQTLISEFLAVVKHPQVVKLLRGALKLKNFKSHLRFPGNPFHKDSTGS